MPICCSIAVQWGWIREYKLYDNSIKRSTSSTTIYGDSVEYIWKEVLGFSCYITRNEAPAAFITEVEQTEDTEASDRGGFLQERPEITCGLHPPGLSWATCVLRSPLPGFPPYASYYISVVGPALMVCFVPLDLRLVPCIFCKCVFFTLLISRVFFYF
jgi:hypothetical protein